MAQFVKKENLTISIGEYEKDGATKKQWRTIGEIITMDDNGKQYQFFKLWGAGGVVEGKVFEQQESNQGGQQQQAPQQQYNNAPQQQAPQYQQQAPQQQQQQQSYGTPPPNHQQR